MFGKVMSIPDDDDDELLPPTHGRHHADELAAMEAALAGGATNPRDLKAQLAREIITRLRGEAAATEAEAHFDRVFRHRETVPPPTSPSLRCRPATTKTARCICPNSGALVRPHAQ